MLDNAGGEAAYDRGSFTDGALGRRLVSKGLGIPDLRYTDAYQGLAGEAEKDNKGIWKDEKHPKVLQYKAQIGELKTEEGVERDESGKVKDDNLFEALSKATKGGREKHGNQGKSKAVVYKQQGSSGGFVPNFNALKDSVGRERAAGYSASQIRIGSSKSLVTSSNPGGMGVYNDTERSLAHGISLATGAGIEPKTKGASKGFIPNFAVDNDSTGLAVMGSVLMGVIAAIKEHTDSIKADTEAIEEKKANLQKSITRRTEDTKANTPALKATLASNRQEEDDAASAAEIAKQEEKNKKNKKHSKVTKIAAGVSAAGGAAAGALDEGPAKAGMQAFSSSLSLASSAVAALPGPVGLAIGGVIAVAGAVVGVAKFFSTSESLRAKAELMKTQLDGFSSASQAVVKAYENYQNSIYDASVSSEKIAQLNNEIAISMARMPEAYRADFEAKMRTAASQGERSNIQADMQAKMSKDVAVTSRLAESSGKTGADFTKSFFTDIVGMAALNGSNRYTNTTFFAPNEQDKIKQKQELNKDVFTIAESATSTKAGEEKYRDLSANKGKSNDDFKNDLANLVPEEARAGVKTMTAGEVELLRARMRQIETARQVSEMMGNVMKPFVEAEREAKSAAQAHINVLRDTVVQLRVLSSAFSAMGMNFTSSALNSKLKGETRIFAARQEYAKGATGEQTGASMDAQKEYVETLSTNAQTKRTDSAKAISDSLAKGAVTDSEGVVALSDKDDATNNAITKAMEGLDLSSMSGGQEQIDAILKNITDPGKKKDAETRLKGFPDLLATLAKIDLNGIQSNQEAAALNSQQSEANKLLAIKKQDDKKFGGIENFLNREKRREDTKEFSKALRMTGATTEEKRGEGAMRLILAAQRDGGGSLSTREGSKLQEMAIGGRAKQIERTADQRIKATQSARGIDPATKANLIAFYSDQKNRSKDIAKEQVERAAKLENAPIDTVAGLTAIKDLLAGELKVKVINSETFTSKSQDATKDAKTTQEAAKDVAKKERVRQQAAGKAGTISNDILQDPKFAEKVKGKTMAQKEELFKKEFEEKAKETNKNMAEKIKNQQDIVNQPDSSLQAKTKLQELKDQDKSNKEEQKSAVKKVDMASYDPKKVIAKDEANKGLDDAFKNNTTSTSANTFALLGLTAAILLGGAGGMDLMDEFGEKEEKEEKEEEEEK